MAAALAAALLLASLRVAAPHADSDPAVENCGTGGADAKARSVAYPIRTMGTSARVILVTADSAGFHPIAKLAHAAFTRVDSLMSNWTTTSEVARLNREAAAGPTPVQPEVATVIDASMRMWAETGGAFDITVEPLVRLWGFLGGPKRVPADSAIAATLERVGGEKLTFDRAARTLSFSAPGMKIDLGGIAKGYAVDVAAEILRGQGIEQALVDLTGNMVAIGTPLDSDAWRIGIRDPRDRLPYFARLRIRDQAISTSGQYEQFLAANGRTYGHILDPKTGRPVDGLISVTVVAATALDCDSWDTPLFVLGGEAARRKALEREDIAVVLVEPGAGGVDTVWVESALRERFALEPGAEKLFVVRYF